MRLRSKQRILKAAARTQRKAFHAQQQKTTSLDVFGHEEEEVEGDDDFYVIFFGFGFF